MSDPVTVTEAALLARDQESQPWQQAFVAVLSGNLTRDDVIARVSDRIGYTQMCIRDRARAGSTFRWAMT